MENVEETNIGDGKGVNLNILVTFDFVISTLCIVKLRGVGKKHTLYIKYGRHKTKKHSSVSLCIS